MSAAECHPGGWRGARGRSSDAPSAQWASSTRTAKGRWAARLAVSQYSAWRAAEGGRPEAPRAPSARSPAAGSEPRRAGQAPRDRTSRRAGPRRELTDDPEAERSLELGAAGAQDEQVRLAREGPRGLEQCRLADAREARRSRPGRPLPAHTPPAPRIASSSSSLEEPAGCRRCLQGHRTRVTLGSAGDNSTVASARDLGHHGDHDIPATSVAPPGRAP